MVKAQSDGCEMVPGKAVAWRSTESLPLIGRRVPEEFELYFVKFLSASDLAKMSAVSRGWLTVVNICARERLRILLRVSDDGNVDSLAMVAQFLRVRGAYALPRLLHVLSHCRESTLRCKLSLGVTHTCVVTRDPLNSASNAVFTFGDGDHGQLGTGLAESSVTPQRVDVSDIVSDEVGISGVACGSQHTVLLSGDGRLIGFGSNQVGQLGQSSETSMEVERDGQHGEGHTAQESIQPWPRLITAGNRASGFTQVVAGKFYTAAVFGSSGRVYIFGRGLDVDTGEDGVLPRGEMAKGERVVQLAAGQEHLLMLTDRNRMFACGSGHAGKLGIARNLEHEPEEAQMPAEALRAHRARVESRGAREPALVADPSEGRLGRIVHIAAGGNHSACVTGDGLLYTWGGCSNGELGLGFFTRCVPRPTRVLLPDSAQYAMHVSCGTDHTAVLTTLGRIVSFGNGVYSQDGKPDRFWATHSPHEIALGDLEHHKRNLAIVVCGGRHTASMDLDGGLFSFGDPMCTGRSIRTASQDFVPRQVALPKEKTFNAVGGNRRRFTSM